METAEDGCDDALGHEQRHVRPLTSKDLRESDLSPEDRTDLYHPADEKCQWKLSLLCEEAEGYIFFCFAT